MDWNSEVIRLLTGWRDAVVAWAVSLNLDPRPTLISFEDATHINLTFSLALDFTSAYTPASWEIDLNGTPLTLSEEHFHIGGAAVLGLHLNESIVSGDIPNITITYTPGVLRGANQVPVQAFTFANP
jgi:hypothetical protein